MRLHEIKNGVVTNTILVNEPDVPHFVGLGYVDDPALSVGMVQGDDGVFAMPPKPVKPIEELRATASITKAAFCTLLKKVGELPRLEAIEAARGVWPKTFEMALAGMPEDVADAAEIEWATATTINRMHPVILLLAQPEHANIDDATLDGWFGIGE
mgnify:CR=1 FL=1